MTPRDKSGGTAAELSAVQDIARIANEDLELQPMLQRITDTVAARFGWEFVALARIDQAAGRFVCEAFTSDLPNAVQLGYSRELGSGVVGQVAATGQPLLFDDVRLAPNYVETLSGVLSEVCVPVKHRGQVVAVLNVESRELATFHGQLPLLETVAYQVASAIAHAILYQDSVRRAAELEILNQLSRVTGEAGELEPLLVRIADDVRRHFRLVIAAVVLADEMAGEFELSAYSGPKIVLPVGSRWPLQFGVVGRAIRSGQTQFVSDVTADIDYLPLSGQVRAELAVPIRFRDSILGAFSFASDDAAVFTPQLRAVLQLLADQVAGAIHLAAMNRRLSEAGASLEDANRQLQQANEALQHLSLVDPLTGVGNRRHFDQVLALEWRRSMRQGSSLALILLDIDAFKEFNDSLGHLEGDRCLRELGALLAASFHRAGDFTARYGGEEFAVILPGCDALAAETVADSLRQGVEKLRIAHPASPIAPWVTISAGAAALVPAPSQRPASLIKYADDALYSAKHSGRNRVVRAQNAPVSEKFRPTEALDKI